MGNLSFAAYFGFETTVGSNLKISMDDPEQLTDVSYLNKEVLENIDLFTAKKFKDFAIAVFNKRSKFSIFEMFSTELKFAFKGWFRQKFKRRFLELNTFSKRKYKTENLVHWNSDKCVNCSFSLLLCIVNSIKLEKMTYYDFIMRTEHMFLRSIYDLEISQKLECLDNIRNFYDSFILFVSVSILLYKFYNEDSNIKYRIF